jgi:hypothetical protein
VASLPPRGFYYNLDDGPLLGIPTVACLGQALLSAHLC